MSDTDPAKSECHSQVQAKGPLGPSLHLESRIPPQLCHQPTAPPPQKKKNQNIHLLPRPNSIQKKCPRNDKTLSTKSQCKIHSTNTEAAGAGKVSVVEYLPPSTHKALGPMPSTGEKEIKQPHSSYRTWQSPTFHTPLLSLESRHTGKSTVPLRCSASPQLLDAWPECCKSLKREEISLHSKLSGKQGITRKLLHSLMFFVMRLICFLKK